MPSSTAPQLAVAADGVVATFRRALRLIKASPLLQVLLVVILRHREILHFLQFRHHRPLTMSRTLRLGAPSKLQYAVQ